MPTHRLRPSALLFLAAAGVAACEPSAGDPTDIALAPTATSFTGFAPAHDDRGPAWTWLDDPTLKVTLSSAPLSPGLHVEHGSRSLSVPADWGLGPTDLPVLLVFGRSDGTSPLAADPSPGLHLLLAGSPEHGCPVDDLELDLVPRTIDGDPDGDIVLDIHISGMPYLALPADGQIIAVAADGVSVVDAATHSQEQGDLQLSGFEGFVVKGSPLGPMLLTSATPLPWFQLQGHSGIVEVDVDHSCEAEVPVTRAELDFRVRI